MCGIIGKVSSGNVVPQLLKGLENLEYRGYDSAGIAFFDDEEIKRIRSVGKIIQLKKLADKETVKSFCAIGHTRWATHGKPTENNAHPHKSPTGKFYVVHNGIIENSEEIKKSLLCETALYESQTDTEVFAHLLEKYYEGQPVYAIAKSLAVLKGSYAFGILCEDFPGTVFGAASGSPLIAVKEKDGFAISSDIGAVENCNGRAYRINNGEICKITCEEIEFFDPSGQKITKTGETVYCKKEELDKGNYKHFMLKEIMEQPKAVKETLETLISFGSIVLPDVVFDRDFIAEELNKIILVGCGSAYHTGLVAKHILEKHTGLSCCAEVASEFRYSRPCVDKNTLVIFISQSGETADTLASLRLAKHYGAQILSVVNVKDSAIATESENVIFTKAGREVAVATTKAYSAQLVALYALSIFLGRVKNNLSKQDEEKLISELISLPEKIKETLSSTESDVKRIAEELSSVDSVFFIGRLSDYATSCEGALKLKEVSYINCQSYPAGELKHGTISLVDNGIPVFAVAGESRVFQKTLSNLCETQARGARLYGVTDRAKKSLFPRSATVICVSDTLPEFLHSLLVLPLQLLSYYTALYRNCDIDRPRNLAKSVTVE